MKAPMCYHCNSAYTMVLIPAYRPYPTLLEHRCTETDGWSHIATPFLAPASFMRIPAWLSPMTKSLYPSEIHKVHQSKDQAVMMAYGFKVGGITESKCIAELMKLCWALTEKQQQ